MKKIAKLAIAAPILAAITLSSFSVNAAPNNCAAKKAAIENQIRIAQQYGNYNKVAGLRKALAEVNAYCNNVGSSNSAAQSLQWKIAKLEEELRDTREDIAEAMADLNEARAQGNSKKIAKYQRELAEEQAEAQQIQRALEHLRAQLASMR